MQNKFAKEKYFSHKDILLYKGDVLDKSFAKEEFADLIVTSPPYNVGIEYNSNDDELNYQNYLEFSEKWMRNCYEWSNAQARFVLNIPLDKN
ncbi:MAG: site-specific DNA-methyltransferase, partial [Chloroflexi bacterium]|nr:site-specific DNA-methyltransferase [Chloroflexota bacterium]